MSHPDCSYDPLFKMQQLRDQVIQSAYRNGHTPDTSAFDAAMSVAHQRQNDCVLELLRLEQQYLSRRKPSGDADAAPAQPQSGPRPPNLSPTRLKEAA